VTTMLPMLCLSCARFDMNAGSCTSFPAGIPDDITTELGDHRVSRSGEQPYQLLPGKEHVFRLWEQYRTQVGR